MPDQISPQFADAWEFASGVSGWLTEAQGELLWTSTERLPEDALVVEIGSHQGRSTTVLAAAVQASGGQVVAVDPFVDGRLFGGRKTRDIFEANLAAAQLTDTVELLPEYSTVARKSWSRPIDYLYIDGKHDYWTLSDDLKWSEHLPEGAPVLIHDCYSSIGVTLGILAHVLPSRRLRYERRAGSLALFRVGKPSVADRLRIVGEIPWWLRNVVVKVLLRLRLGVVAKALFGHRGPYDPY
ncbi:class I SAM-dependent methyltransferase [Nocardioides sp. URHA0020]|uniref:class I SAM-dependent methyltransferase n=1 Tax=Nocardioides sp. URHA0020 TaxID=1380392 RepID=UPI0006866B63|nr:class I SAM-dependent methyltransferase [Nocardioides sp. URHA0020]